MAKEIKKTLHLELDVEVHHLTDEQIGKMIWNWERFVRDGEIREALGSPPPVMITGEYQVLSTLDTELLKGSYTKSLEKGKRSK